MNEEDVRTQLAELYKSTHNHEADIDASSSDSYVEKHVQSIKDATDGTWDMGRAADYMRTLETRIRQ